MNRLISVILICILVIACQSRKAAQEYSNLPKDISQMPKKNPVVAVDNERKIDENNMLKLRTEIEDLINEEHCTDAKDWRISPLGSKACGGPASYIAYPIKLEREILPKITEFNRQSSAYNLEYGVMSDCGVTASPTKIVCESGRAVLVYSEEKK